MTDGPIGVVTNLVQPNDEAVEGALMGFLDRAGEFESVIIIALRKDGHPEHVVSTGTWNSKICWLIACFQKWMADEIL